MVVRLVQRILLLTLSILLAGQYAGVAVAISFSSGQPYSVLVVAGQSNAVGNESLVNDGAFNLFGSSADPADTDTHLLFSNSTHNNGADASALTTPQPSSEGTIFGPEVGLARRLHQLGRRRVVILKVAFSGQPLAQSSSENLDWNVHSTNEAYARLLARASQLNTWFNHQRASYSYDGFYWMQGEADSKAGLAPLYEQNLRDLFTQARSDLNMNPSAQFVIGKTSTSASTQFGYDLSGDTHCAPYTCAQVEGFNQQVRAAQQAVADSMPNTSIVETEDLPHIGFKVHLSNQGQLLLGQRFANITEQSSAKRLPTQKQGLLKSFEQVGIIKNTSGPQTLYRDGGSSIKLGDKILWMFGDTLFTTAGIDGRSGRSNTAALANPSTPYNLSEPLDANGAPSLFIPYSSSDAAYNQASTNPNDRYVIWPSSAINSSPTTGYVYFHRLKSTPSGDSGSLSSLGVGIASVSADSTTATTITDSLFSGSDPAFRDPIVKGNTVYVRNCEPDGFDANCAFGRAPLSQVTQRSAYQFWNGTSWQSDITQASYSVAGARAAMSITWNDYLQKFVMVWARSYSKTLNISTADEITGPWQTSEYAHIDTLSKFPAIFYFHPELSTENGKTMVLSTVENYDQLEGDQIYAFKLTFQDGGNTTTDQPSADQPGFIPGAPNTGQLKSLSLPNLLASATLLVWCILAAHKKKGLLKKR